MKVELFYPEHPIEWVEIEHRDYAERNRVNESVLIKITGQLIDIPCTPVVGMKIYLADFEDVFGFTEDEIIWVQETSAKFITRIYIKPDRLELWLEDEII